MTLPEGHYILNVQQRSLPSGYLWNGTLSADHGDTFAITAGMEPLEIELQLAALHLALETPPEWGDGELLQAYIHPVDGQGLRTFANIDSEAGTMQVEIEPVPAGVYRVSLVRAGDERIWLPPTYEMDEADQVEVEAGEVKNYESTIPSPARLTGTMTGSWRELGTDRPLVKIFDQDSTRIHGTYVDGGGEFSVELYRDMRVRLTTQIDEIERWYGGSDFSGATEFNLELGRETHVDILESGIGGYLYGSGHGVDLYDQDGQLLGHSRIHPNERLFRFANLGPGTYYLRIQEGERWVAHWYDGADSIEAAAPVEIAEEGEIVWVRPTNLVEGGSISGQLLDPDGEPVRSALMELTRADYQPRVLRTQHVASEDGHYEQRYLENGEYKLSALTEAWGQVWYPGVADWDSAGVITIEDHSHLMGIDIQFLR
jgi:hypothetical protein